MSVAGGEPGSTEVTLHEFAESYTSPELIRLLGLKNDARPGPCAVWIPATVLFADISGFTPLVERYAARGPLGLEGLCGVINDCFSLLIDSVKRWDGQILCFPGDAVLALWHGDEDRAARGATQCARELQRAFAAGVQHDGGSLQIRIALGHGRTSVACVGGSSGRAHLVASGAPIAQIRALAPRSRPGEVVQSDELLAALAVGPGPDDPARWDAATATRATDSVVGPPLLHDALLRSLLQRSVTERLRIGSAGWLAELRTISVLFTMLDIGVLRSEDEVTRLQAAVAAAQDAIEALGGEVNQVVDDDKGLVVVSGWGLPSHTHENDPERALLAARRVRAALASLGVGTSQGVATGRAYCGDRGSTSRREYAMVGSTVNLAARLMERAPGQILCDAVTARGAERFIKLRSVGAISVKGRADPVEVFTPTEEAPRDSGRVSIREGLPLVGRAAEIDRIREAMDVLALGGGGGVVVIEGEAGIGKSTLLGGVAAMAARAGLRCLVGCGDPVELTTPWLAWRPIVRELLGVRESADAAERAAIARAALAPWPERLPWTSLLGPLLDAEIAESEVVRAMPATVRREATTILVADLLEHASASSSLVVVIDDAHWADSLSLSLAVALCRRGSAILFIASARPDDSRAESDYLLLRDLAEDGPLALGRMAEHEIRELVRTHLDVSEVPEAVHRFIEARAEGHPFFSVELALAVRDTGILGPQGDGFRSDDGPAQDLGSLVLPGSIEGVIAGRIDRLSPEEQFTLRVASVVGRSFTLDELGVMHPLREDRARLMRQLETLRDHHLADPDEQAPNLGWTFKHAIIRDVAYQQLMPSQRARLHHHLADWHEWRGGTEHPALLAHHFGHAGDASKEMHYLGLAGADAARRGAYREAIRAFERLLSLGATSASAADRARWLRLLGDAYFGVGHLAESQRSFEASIALSDHPLPRSSLAWAVVALGSLLRLIVRTALPSFGLAPEGRRAGLTESARVTGALAEQNYYRMDLLPYVGCTLLSVDFAERAAAPAAAARGYSGLGHIAGLARRWGFAERCFRISRENPEDARSTGMNDNIEGLTAALFGRFAEARSLLERGLAVNRSVGDSFAQGSGYVMLGQALDWWGRLGEGLAVLSRLLVVATEAENRQHLVWARTLRAISYSHAGRFDEALRDLAAAEPLLPEADGLGPMLFAGATALVNLRMGDLDRARAGAEQALTLVEAKTTHAFCYAWPYVGVVETFLALSAIASARRERARHLTAARRVARGLAILAALHPVFRARAARVDAEIARAEGRLSRARALAKRSLDQAVRHDTEYDLALAALLAAEIEPIPSLRAVQHAAARDRLLRLGAVVPPAEPSPPTAHRPEQHDAQLH